jgi:glycosyltransferase involved in cell wall biosynthesis
MLMRNETHSQTAIRVCYVVLSPTFGMQQYTAGLANRIAGAFETEPAAVWPTVVVTNQQVPHDRYAPAVSVKPVVDIAGTGLQKTNLSWRGFEKVYHAIRTAQADVVHFSAPHVWNPALLFRLKRAGVKTVHTIHDLDPHSGTGYGRLLYVWNNSILRWADAILVHGQIYQKRLAQKGLSDRRLGYMPLLHLFLSYESEAALRHTQPAVTFEPFALFFARIEAYKGIDTLFEAMRQLSGNPRARAIVAGRGELSQAAPENVEVRNRLMGDAEAIDLFRRCSVVVLPYRDATQSALIAAAYFFGKPVIVTRTGALPEYVRDGVTGWVIEPDDVTALADRINAAISDPARVQMMGQAGGAWYEAQYHDEKATLRRMYERVAQA